VCYLLSVPAKTIFSHKSNVQQKLKLLAIYVFFFLLTEVCFFSDCGLQKWSKGKVRDKLNNLVLFDKATYDKLYKEVPSYKLITPSVVSERLKIRGSLARNALKELQAKGKCFK